MIDVVWDRPRYWISLPAIAKAVARVMFGVSFMIAFARFMTFVARAFCAC